MASLGRFLGLVCVAALAAVVAGDVRGAATAPKGTTTAAATARGWPMRQEGIYLIVETPHYIVKTDHKAEVGQLIASQQEAVFQELYRRLSGVKAGVQQIQRLQIVFFTTKEKYLEVMGKDGEGTQGRYIPGKNMISGWTPPEEIDNMLRTLRHEGTHQFVEQFIGPKCPLWLNEGLAVYFENSTMKDGQLMTGETPLAMVSPLKRAPETGKLIPLARMLNMAGEEWTAALKTQAPQGTLQYYEAWSMVHFLQGAENGKYRAPLLQFIYYIARSSPVTEAWDKTFGAGSAPAFEKRWQEYIKDLKPTGGLGCRGNLQILGFLLIKNQGVFPEWKDMDEFYQAAMAGRLGGWVMTLGDGTKIDGGKDKDTMKSLFRCPEDLPVADKPDYELIPARDGQPQGVRCRHHQGFVMETTYVKNAKGDWESKVVARLASSN
jgi:hypothetical protein